jgi:hypothetical protein
MDIKVTDRIVQKMPLFGNRENEHPSLFRRPRGVLREGAGGEFHHHASK